MANLLQIRLPGIYCFFIVLPLEKPGDRIPFASLNDVPPDRDHDAAIGSFVSRASGTHDTGVTHVVNRSAVLRAG